MGREHQELASAHMMFHADWMERVSRSTADPIQFEEWSQAHQQKLDELWHNWSFLLSALRRLKARSSGEVAATGSSLIVLLERTSFHPSLTTADFEAVVSRLKQAQKEGRLPQEKAKWLDEVITKMELREYTRLLNELVKEGQEP
jgi:hypothetical protein